MRIYGNRQLKTLPGQNTRPTAARVREALFNIWQGQIADCFWLDLCAGNGSMGAEALCRGATEVVGIEKNIKACSIIKQNWQKVATTEQKFQVIRGDVTVKINLLKKRQFDLIYFDPPYDSNLYQPVLNAIASRKLLTPEGKIAVEHNSRFWQANEIPGLEIYQTKNYGNTTITFYHSQENINLRST
ncbi:MAG: 16S rRNA (guanine(966)-N(2))-methyltransferase RsmD [Xenococcus sp. (in: cyanobacteria)]